MQAASLVPRVANYGKRQIYSARRNKSSSVTWSTEWFSLALKLISQKICRTYRIVYRASKYSLHSQKESRFGQRYGLQNTTLTFYFYKNNYQKVIYVYFYENIFQDKSINIIFIFSNLTTWELFMIYIPKVWLKPCPKRHVLRVQREYSFKHTVKVLKSYYHAIKFFPLKFSS